MGRGTSVIVVVLGLVVALSGCTSENGPTPPADDGGPPPSSPAAEGIKAADTVRSYLEAIAGGHAGEARALVLDAPTDAPFLTDEVLAKSQAIAPLTDIVLAEVTETRPESVRASYKLGDRQISYIEFPVSRQADGSYLLDGVAKPISSSDVNGLPLVVNGVKGDTGEVAVFPGVYEISTSSEYVDLEVSNFEVRSAGDFDEFEPEYSLTTTGRETFVKAFRSSIDKCIASAKLDAGCGLVPLRSSDYELIEGTVERELTEEAKAYLENPKVRIDDEEPVAEASGVKIRVRTQVDCKKGSTRSTCDAGQGRLQMGTATADLTELPLKIVWR